MENPSNQTLKVMIDNSIHRSDERHGEILDVLEEIKNDVKDTKAQAMKTNGRVTTLELTKSSDIKWMKALLGGIWAIVVLALGIGIPIMNRVSDRKELQLQKTIQEKIDATNKDNAEIIKQQIMKAAKEAVDTTFASYNIKVEND